MFAKPLISVVISVLVVVLIYGPISTSSVFAVPPDPRFDSRSENCKITENNPKEVTVKCCWRERVPGQILADTYCQSCTTGKGSSTKVDCEPKVKQLQAPTTGENVPPGGVAEQPEQPLFGGQNDASVPPTGGIEQPPTATTQPTPGGGAEVPTEGGTAEQPTAPQDDQGDNQGGGLPPIKNQENVPQGGDVAEQPEDNGQEEESSEGEPTAGPLT